MLHTLGHGGILRSVSFLSVHYQIAWLLEVIAFGAVNTYAMISGFVSVDSHFKISNILILWLQVLFYGILINTVFFFSASGKQKYIRLDTGTLSGHSKRILVFYCLCRSVFSLPIHQSDVSESLRKADKNFILFYSYRIFCGSDHFTDFYTAAGCFYMGDGYSVFWLTLMYLLGACIKKLNLVSHSKKKKYFILYFFCILITWSSKILVEKFPVSGFTLDSSFLIHYTSPFIVLAAMSLLLIFGSMNFSESVKKNDHADITSFFRVYLLHDHPLVRSYVMTDRFAFITNGSVSKMLLFFFGIILAIFVVGCCVDAVRSKLFQLLHIRKSLSKLDRYFDV